MPCAVVGSGSKVGLAVVLSLHHHSSFITVVIREALKLLIHGLDLSLRPAMSFGALPAELVSEIADHVDDPYDLISFVTTNKFVCNASGKRLAEHRRLQDKYSSLGSISGAFSEQLSGVVDIHRARYYVQHFGIGQVHQYDDLSLLTPAAQKVCQECITHNRLWPADHIKNFQPSLRTLQNEQAVFEDVTNVTAMLLPLLPNVRTLKLYMGDRGDIDRGTGLREFALILQGHLLDQKLAQRIRQQPYKMLTTLWLCYSDGFSIEHLFPFLGLPNLQNLFTQCMQSQSAFKPRGWFTQLPHVAPLQKLVLETNNVSSDYLDRLFSFTQSNTLRHFRSKRDRAQENHWVADYRPKRLVKSLQRYSRDSLQCFELLTEEDFYYYNIPHDFIDDAPGTGSRPQRYAFDEKFNLAGFTNLRDVILDAELLLNGYGIYNCIDMISEVALGDIAAFEPWQETFDEGALSWADMLPRSLETLHIYVTDFQWEVVKWRMRELAVDCHEMESLPSLKEVRMSQIYPHNLCAILWTSEKGFTSTFFLDSLQQLRAPSAHPSERALEGEPET